jgi:hypothetical protein
VTLTANQKVKRLNTLIALAEWSDRSPDMEWYQLGGMHFKPLPGEKHRAKIQVDHATQARFYAAISKFLDAERGYSEALQELLDLAWVGQQLRRRNRMEFDYLWMELDERRQEALRTV